MSITKLNTDLPSEETKQKYAGKKNDDEISILNVSLAKCYLKLRFQNLTV